MQNLILFGGTFDPPHLGHLNTALAVQNHFHFERFIVLPCKLPVLKKASTASSEQRVHMLKLTFQPYPEFEIDLREIHRETPSFMVDTLQSLRNELGSEIPITLLLGRDAFLQLPQWYKWEKILELCNLLVIQRACTEEVAISGQLSTLVKQHEVTDKSELLKQPFGKIYQYNAGEYPISSSELRQKIARDEDVAPYLPEGVYQYIKNQTLY